MPRTKNYFVVAFSQTFDTVNHDMLVQRLYYYQLKGIANNWFNTFLKNRYQFTNIKECSFEKQKPRMVYHKDLY